jgi:DNA-binding PadR family transcriptional regulator
MARESKTKYAILGALNIHPMSGYDIKNWLTKVTGSFWSESDGQIYPALANLQKINLIRIEKNSSSSKRLRNVYRLTKKGEKELDAWLEKPTQTTTIRSELVLKLFYGKRLTNKQYIAHIKRRELQVLAKLQYYQEITEHLKKDHKNDPDTFYWLITLNRTETIHNAELNWCHETLKMIKNKKKLSLHL